MIKHFLSITDFTPTEILRVLDMSLKIKKSPRKFAKVLSGKTLAMIFEKPSLRTRVSFEVAMTQLGGHAIYLAPADIGLGVREPIKDVSRVLSRMVDIVMARTFKHETIAELAKYSGVPVINALSDLEHPCQIMADLLTIKEKKQELKGINLTFLGDGENNVTHSLALASALLGIDFTVAAPKGFWMSRQVSKKAKLLARKYRSVITETDKVDDAINNADVVYTDTWISMGDEKEKEKRLKIFKKYRVDLKLMSLAKKDAIFMHDMPAYRGNEVASDVIDGKQSVVIDQAENRLHAQKALICHLLGVKV
ncbi:MAG: Ornithine carbamoyltransferase, catabolic [Candidatus Woesebacteria bacterium GW2011_GWA1_37_7]|uniref:Ornithine carbamoyltransferase n=1 Tax=Candidatus Woesebacteria bacterium GW2011_GWA1_37_7 TaxID=1618545 RepID=A0A0G0GZ02_9BACT|nr:MAG: Ornithine carbamoyltransferase, catabolic [Candidatus Woesebacteria bacterium GW2011_GWA1_37_7]